jgi:hypothetical protein
VPKGGAVFGFLLRWCFDIKKVEFTNPNLRCLKPFLCEIVVREVSCVFFFDQNW